MTTGQFDTIPLSYVRDSAKLLLGIRDTVLHDQVIDFHITQCISNVLRSSGLTGVQNCTLPICDNSAKLPHGLMKLIGVRAPINQNSESQTVIPTTLSWIYLDRAFINEYDNSVIGGENLVNNLMIRDGYIYFNNPPEDLTEVEIAWLGQLLDDDGNFKVYAKYQMCLQFYAAYMVGITNPTRWPQAKEYYNRFLAAKDAARGRDAKDKFDETRTQIRGLLRSWYGYPSPTYKTY